MFRRQFLLVLLAVIGISPVVAFADPAENPSVSLITNDSRCDAETLGVSDNGATVAFEPVWEPDIYSCAAGYYLPQDVIRARGRECVQCPENSFCEGFTDVAFNESDMGKGTCDTENYPYAAAGNTSESGCYKLELVSCDKVNPYSVTNGTPVYANESVQCKIYSGSESDCDELVVANACEVTGATCETGTAVEVDGHWICGASGDTPKETVTCAAGTYLPAGAKKCEICPKDNYCPGTGKVEVASVDQGLVSCQGLKAPQGARVEEDCGMILRVNGDALYLHSDKRGPSLVIQDPKDPSKKWYADMSPVTSDGAKPISTESNKKLHVMVGNQDYTVHSVSYDE